MQQKPYFCPNCRSNRVKFSVIARSVQPMMKDAVTGEITQFGEMEAVPESEPMIRCQVCSFEGNELRFVKQAEREPRQMTPTPPNFM